MGTRRKATGRKRVRDTFTNQRRMFCDAYLIHFNSTQAAIDAGYSEKTAYVMGTQLLQDPQVNAYVTERKKEAFRNNKELARRVLEELAAIAFSNTDDLIEGEGTTITVKKINRERGRLIQTISSSKGAYGDTVDIKVHDKKFALDALMRHLGLYEIDNAQRSTAIQTITIGGKVIEF